MNKKQAQQEHAKRRARERFGCKFTHEDEQEIIEKIQNGVATFIQKQTNRISLFGVIYQGVETVIVYDRERKVVVTLMPRDYFELNTPLEL